MFDIFCALLANPSIVGRIPTDADVKSLAERAQRIEDLIQPPAAPEASAPEAAQAKGDPASSKKRAAQPE